MKIKKTKMFVAMGLMFGSIYAAFFDPTLAIYLIFFAFFMKVRMQD